MADDAPLPQITINIKGPAELKLALQISPSAPVAELKDAIAAQSQIPREQQRLIYSGKVLKDDDPLSQYKVQSGHSIHLVKGAARGAAGAASSTASSGTAAATAPGATSEARGVPSNMGAGMQFAGNPLAALEGVQGHGMGGGVFNPFAGMGAGNLNDPNALTDLMNDPDTISRMMSQITPEMMDQMIATNPQLASMGPQVREMMNSPMMRQMMSDPAMIRQMMQMYGGPAGLAGAARGGAGGGAPGMFGAAGAGAGAGPGLGAPPSPFGGMGGFGGLGGLGAGVGAGAGAGAGGPGSPGATANPFGMTPAMMQQLMGMGGAGGAGAGGFGGLGGFGGGAAGGGSPAPPADTRSLEERFQAQLLQLNEMGLIDPQQNIRALQMTGGNVEAAIELIFSGRVPPSS